MLQSTIPSVCETFWPNLWVCKYVSKCFVFQITLILTVLVKLLPVFQGLSFLQMPALSNYHALPLNWLRALEYLCKRKTSAVVKYKSFSTAVRQGYIKKETNKNLQSRSEKQNYSKQEARFRASLFVFPSMKSWFSPTTQGFFDETPNENNFIRLQSIK